MSGDSVVPMTRRGVYLPIGALLLGMLLAALDQTIVATALPTIVSDLGGMDHLSWVVTAYLLAVTAATPLWGKLGDQYGRKRLFQSAILIFLVGSALCGVAQNMPQLIGFRAVQGLGGGGLITLSMAIVGDLVPPRERGRFQGLFGAVFGTTSVLGPLLGGFFTEQLNWRWVFYINLPIGALALVVIALALHIPAGGYAHRIDYLGTLLIASAATCVVLVTSLGGTTWDWNSAQVYGLAVLAAVLVVAFVLVERRAVEPVLPMSLFAVRNFTLCAAISFVIGFAMFGAMTYLPTFLQVVHGVSPTMSGVHMLPMVLGVIAASTVSGQLITHTGHWKFFPVVGTGVTTGGLLLLHRLAPDSSQLEMSAYFAVFGIGLGLVLQVLVLVAQNAVRYADLGVATSGVTFFRSIGASVGVAVFGAIFASRLGGKLADALRGQPLPAGVSADSLKHNPQSVSRLPAGARRGVLGAYSESITDVFLFAAPLAFVAFVLTWFFVQQRLRRSVQVPDEAETLAPCPVERSSADEAARALSRLNTLEGRRDLYERITERAGMDLRPAASWMLLRVHHDGPVEPALIPDDGTIPRRVVADAARQLEERGLAEREGLQLVATARGAEAARALSDARQELLAEELGDWWGPDRPTDLTQLVRQLNEEIGRAEPPRAA
ncbi:MULTISPECIES: MDR family MFS transporter [Streptomyces]|uniref:EmrB/QacA family drug resistance transporter n=1 Tax=Streptomyces cacaoi TaxID=1898 RepID=A0A4Y3QZ54_STRCI|nr:MULTISPECIES: MDR family MFS transporter [Streptomyces]NNG86333.1 MFS transporter [Streptomyces cacaoi]QHF93668.1 EmrB/QacA family drug resistance transporter [Streptomyces sp. NHF165]GEB50259.1 EmrB/QacA family drug resistance transporter [Streptomyces cacaoi]